MMEKVRAKKQLGQHFLKDETIAKKIADSLSCRSDYVIEIGPGMGVLTKYLLQKPDINLSVVEIDRESVAYLEHHYPELSHKIIAQDFLTLKLDELYQGSVSIIGNFPYNISSQILFKAFEYKSIVPELVGMFQKEVAERIASKPGNKHYGILSVLLQAFFDIEYLFTVNEDVFSPPPKVKSAVIRMTRNTEKKLDSDEKLFKHVVKTAFNQRRKTLRNSLKSFSFKPEFKENPIFNKRPEQLSVAEFDMICLNITENQAR